MLAAETPPPLRSLHTEVRRLQAALDAERFDKNYLQDELLRTNSKLERLTQDKEQYKCEIVSLKAKILDCCGQEGDDKDQSPTSNIIKAKLTKQLGLLEDRLVENQALLDEALHERDINKAKVDELKVEREKWVDFGLKESLKSGTLEEQLEEERRNNESLKELVAELRQHHKQNNIDTSLLECDDPDNSIQSLGRNLSICNEVCANVVEVQLSEERANIVVLKQQIQDLHDTITYINKEKDILKTENDEQNKNIHNQVIEIKQLKEEKDHQLQNLSEHIKKLEDVISKVNNENTKFIIENEKKKEEINNNVVELQSLSDQIKRLEQKINEISIENCRLANLTNAQNEEIQRKVIEINQLQEEKFEQLQSLSIKIKMQEDKITEICDENNNLIYQTKIQKEEINNNIILQEEKNVQLQSLSDLIRNLEDEMSEINNLNNKLISENEMRNEAIKNKDLEINTLQEQKSQQLQTLSGQIKSLEDKIIDMNNEKLILVSENKRQSEVIKDKEFQINKLHEVNEQQLETLSLQMKRLEDKISEINNENYDLKNKNKALNEVINIKVIDINHLQEEKDQQLENLSDQIKILEDNIHEINDINNKLITKNRKQHEENNHKEIEINKLKEEKDQQLHTLLDQVKGLESKVIETNNEKDKLKLKQNEQHQEINNKVNEINLLQEQKDQLLLTLSSQITTLQTRISEISNENSKLIKENEEIKNKSIEINQLQEEKNQRLLTLSSQIKIQEQDISEINIENDKLRSENKEQYEQLNNEVIELNKVIKEKEQQLHFISGQIKSVEDKLSEMNDDNDKLRLENQHQLEEINNKVIEINEVQEQKQQLLLTLSGQITTLEISIRDVNNENLKLAGANKQQNDENKSKSIKIKELQEDKEQQFQTLSGEVKKLEGKITEINNENVKLKSENIEQHEEINNKLIEINTLQDEKDQQLQTFEGQITNLQDMISKINNVNCGLELENKKLSKEIIKKNIEINQLQEEKRLQLQGSLAQINSLKEIISEINNQNNRLDTETEQKNEEINNYIISGEAKDVQLQFLSDQIKSLEDKVSEMNSENYKLRTVNEESKDVINKNVIDINQLQEEKDKLLHSLSGQITTLQDEISETSKQNCKLETIKETQNEEIKNMSVEISQLQEEKEQQLQSLSVQIKKLKDEITEISNEKHKLRTENREQCEEINNKVFKLNQSQEEKDRQIHTLLGQVTKLEHRITEINEHSSGLLSDNKKQNEEIENKVIEINNLRKENYQQLQSYSEQINSLEDKIRDINNKNDKLENENKMHNEEINNYIILQQEKDEQIKIMSDMKKCLEDRMAEINYETDKLRKENSKFETENMECNDLIKKKVLDINQLQEEKDQQLQTLSDNIKHMEHNISEMKNENTALITKNEKLYEDLENKVLEINKLHGENDVLQHTLSDQIERLENEINKINDENYKMRLEHNDILNKKVVEINKLEEEKDQQTTSLSGLIKTLEDRITEISKENCILQTENKQQNEEIKTQSMEINKLQIGKSKEMQTKLERIKELENKITEISNEDDKLRTINRKQCDDINIKVIEIKKLQEEKDNQLNTLSSERKMLEDKISEINDKNCILCTENKKQNEEIQNKTIKINQLHKKHNLQLQTLADLITRLEDKITKTNHENENLITEINKQNYNKQENKHTNTLTLPNNITVSEENNNLDTENEECYEVINNTFIKIYQLQEEKYREQLTLLSQIKTLEEIVTKINNEHSRLIIDNKQQKEEIENKAYEVKQLQEEKYQQIHILSQQFKNLEGIIMENTNQDYKLRTENRKEPEDINKIVIEKNHTQEEKVQTLQCLLSQINGLELKINKINKENYKRRTETKEFNEVINNKEIEIIQLRKEKYQQLLTLSGQITTLVEGISDIYNERYQMGIKNSEQIEVIINKSTVVNELSETKDQLHTLSNQIKNVEDEITNNNEENILITKNPEQHKEINITAIERNLLQQDKSLQLQSLLDQIKRGKDNINKIIIENNKLNTQNVQQTKEINNYELIIDQYDHKVQSLSDQINILEDIINKINKENDILSAENKELHNEINNKKIEIDQLQKEKCLQLHTSDQIKMLEEKIGKISCENSLLESKIKELNEESKNKELEVNQLKEEKDQKLQNLSDRIIMHEYRIEEIHNENYRLSAEIKELHNEINNKKIEIDQLQKEKCLQLHTSDQIKMLEEKIGKISCENSLLESKIKELNEESKNKELEVNQLKEEKDQKLQNLSDRITMHEYRIKEIHNENDQLLIENKELNSKLKMTEGYEMQIMNLNEKVLCKNKDLMDLQEHLLLKTNLINAINMDLKKQTALYEESKIKYSVEVTTLRDIIEKIKSDLIDKDNVITQLQTKLRKSTVPVESSNTVMEVRAEYEDKLNRMKAKMRDLYKEQIAIFRDKQKEENALMEIEVQKSRKEYADLNQEYSNHVKRLTTELWNIGQKFLIKEEEVKWLRQKHGSLMSLQNVHSTGQYLHHDDRSRQSDTHSLRSLPVHINKTEGRGLPMSEEEGEVFDNRWLKELNSPSSARHTPPGSRLSELRWRNSLCPPHLKSSYPAETQFTAAINEDDIKCNENVRQRKEVGITAYKKPGPPTPSKHAGRLSATDSDLRESLRAEHDLAHSRKTSTPARLRAFFRSSKADDNSGTPRRRLSIFRSKK